MLAALGLEFEAVVPAVEELTEGEPGDVVLENARRKARAGLELAGPIGDAALVVGVDTDVALGGRLLGKPADPDGARERLEALSGRAHDVLSGLCVLAGGRAGEHPDERAAVARSEVRFRALEPAEIDRYLASEEWRDRAGGYAIQGLGSTLVESLHGDFANVVGLPVALLLHLAPELEKP